MLVTRAITSSALVVCITTVLLAQAPALDVKLGLWENTIVTDMGTAMAAQMDTSKLPPEQAAKIAEAMKAMAGKPIVQKTCLTKEDLSKDSFMMPEDSKTKCSRTITTAGREHRVHGRAGDEGTDQRRVPRRRHGLQEHDEDDLDERRPFHEHDDEHDRQVRGT